MDIFSGLDKLGFDNIDIDDLYAKVEVEKHEEQKETVYKPVIKEADLLFDKSYVCPVCDNKIKAKTVKTGKARVAGTDVDLRPRYDGIEPLKYDVVLCNKCGYAALSRYFVTLAGPQRKLIKEKISANYKSMEPSGEIYTYEEAISRYKLALLNSVVKISKASEKAYICLKAGWLARSFKEELIADNSEEAKIEAARSMEDEFLKKAYEGYRTAYEQEKPPISGMDGYTVSYLLAVLAKEYGTLEDSAKLVAGILTSRNCPDRIKDKARDLKDEIIREKKQ